MSAIKDLYDLERYFGAGHWISRDGKIEVPLKSAEHAEIAPDVVEKYYKDDFLDMDPSLSLSDYSDFLLGKGWIVHRENNFFCWRLDNTTKDTIFLFAKKNNLLKITVETPQKVKLIEEPPEMLYEQKMRGILAAWIDETGKTYYITEPHESFARQFIHSNHHIDTSDFEKYEVYSNTPHTLILLKLGWIRFLHNSFSAWRLTNKVKDHIFMFAKNNNIEKIYVDEWNRLTSVKNILVNEPPENIYEAIVPIIKLGKLSKLEIPWDDYDLKEGYWIDPKGKIYVTETHADFSEEFFKHKYEWEESNDRLLDLGWIAQRKCSFSVRKWDKNIKDNIFMRAKECNCKKISVDFGGYTGKKTIKLFEKEPKALYELKLKEQKNYQRFFAWIDPNGKVHKCDSGQIHDSWAHDYLLKNHRLMWNVLKSDNVDDSRVFTEYLLERGWVRQSNCSFETNSMRKSVCWNIYEAAKNIGCNSVFIDYHGSIIEAPIEKFIEENGQ